MNLLYHCLLSVADHSNSSTLPPIVSELQQSNLVNSELLDVAESYVRGLVCTAVIDNDDFIGELGVLVLDGGREGEREGGGERGRGRGREGGEGGREGEKEGGRGRGRKRGGEGGREGGREGKMVKWEGGRPERRGGREGEEEREEGIESVECPLANHHPHAHHTNSWSIPLSSEDKPWSHPSLSTLQTQQNYHKTIDLRCTV